MPSNRERVFHSVGSKGVTRAEVIDPSEPNSWAPDALGRRVGVHLQNDPVKLPLSEVK
jgi:hypothetical protein